MEQKAINDRVLVEPIREESLIDYGVFENKSAKGKIIDIGPECRESNKELLKPGTVVVFNPSSVLMAIEIEGRKILSIPDYKIEFIIT